MKELALNLPGFDNVINTPNNRFSDNPLTPVNETSVGYFISELLPLALYVAAFMMFIWIVWGVFQYILAEGNKERLAHARSRIRWAIIGFVILLLSVFVSEYLQQPGLLPNTINNGITPVSSPLSRMNQGL
jgi:hypothetical protein